mgnify:CR=1 FL=1
MSLIHLTACGYLLYPERKNNEPGKIDPTIVILDAAGLLFGILPGVVAFAVDITTGTIFLSPNEKSAIEKHKKNDNAFHKLDLDLIPHNEISVDLNNIIKQLSVKTGQAISGNDIVYYTTDISKPIQLTLLENKYASIVHYSQKTLHF